MSTEHEADRGPRVLVVGQDAEVLGCVVDEIAAAEIRITGVTVAELGTVRREPFDLVAFGSGVAPALRSELRRGYGALNPATRFLSTYAPYAASQVVQAVRSAGEAPLVDLQAYCRRTGYEGSPEPTLPALRALHARHISRIPFEAIDVLLGRGVDISPEAVDSKLIASRRGGYCFEQNGLFKRVLRQIGFQVDALAASVRWMAVAGTPPPPRTHQALRVQIDGTGWLVDAGFGVSVPPAPLRLDTSEPQATSHGDYRIVPFGQGFLVQALIEGRWQSLYDVSSEPLLDGHFEMPNWFTSTHPSSHFRHRLSVARTTAETRYSLIDGRFTIRHADGQAERRMLDAAEIAHALDEHFLLPPQDDWSDLLERAAASSAALLAA